LEIIRESLGFIKKDKKKIKTAWRIKSDISIKKGF